MFQTMGYLVSTVSLFLIAAVAWDGTHGDPTLRWLLIAGIVTSILGMLLRWIAYRKDEKARTGAVAQLASREPAASRPRRASPSHGDVQSSGR